MNEIMARLTRPMSTRRAALFGVLAAASTFLFDLNQPLGVAGAMPYAALPLLGLLSRQPRAVVMLAIGGSALAVLGAVLSTEGATTRVVVMNRTMSLTMTWIITAISIRHLAIGDKLWESLERQATRDQLTGLYNRHYVIAIIETELMRYRRYGVPFSLVMIDADHFKVVNDQFGHSAGDAVLQQIAGLCTQAVRETDVVGRYGGEEFILLMPHTNAMEAAGVAERIRASAEAARLDWDGQSIAVTLSFGVQQAGSHADTVNGLIQQADKALYAAKRAGRNRVAIADYRSIRAA